MNKLIKNLNKIAETLTFGAPKEETIQLLRKALASELIAVQFYASAGACVTEEKSQFFREHSEEEQVHYNDISDRITELGGKPIFTVREAVELAPIDLETSSKTTEKPSLVELAYISKKLEELAIEHYKKVIAHVKLAEDDSTLRLIQKVLSEEEEHRADFEAILEEEASLVIEYDQLIQKLKNILGV